MAFVPLLVLAAVLDARAELPLPAFPDCGKVPYDWAACPSDFAGKWWLYSYIPENSLDGVRPAELALGSGIWADVAWRTTTGRYDVVVAVGDSGIGWNRTDLVNKVRLNLAELQPPQRSSGDVVESWDLDGNGIINVADWAEDPRVSIEGGVEQADWLLDPGDLIAAFSDGVDDDGNGFVDDIAGWDFYQNDNDPWNTYDDDYGTHGSGVMLDAVAEGNNGGDIGVCPNCSVVPLRLADTFVVDGTRTAAAIAYAAELGVDVMGLAVGALSNPRLAPEAMRRAREKGMLIVAAAGDENAYHHNMPAMNDDAVYVHSIRGDGVDDSDPAYSFMNFFNCNNFGPRMDLVSGSPACATGSVANIAGAAGLILSAARDLGVELSPDEVRQLLVVSADDVWLSEAEVDDASTYPSDEGWDFFYGYGRVNVARAVQRVVDGDIPPVARLTGPGWFTLVDPVAAPELTLTLDMGAARTTGSFTWVLERGVGGDPRTWQTVANGSEAAPVVGKDVVVSVGDIGLEPPGMPENDEGVVGRAMRVHENAVTFRLTVTDGDGRWGEQRRTLMVQHDPAVLPGWPVHMVTSGESSPILADLTGDGVFEVIVGTSDGEVLALHGDGLPVPGWPVQTAPDLTFLGHESAPAFEGLDLEGAGIMATVAVGDLDGDGSPEVVAGTVAGAVYAWHADGAPVAGFPVELLGHPPEAYDTEHTWDKAVGGAPTLEDLDGDGTLEIIVLGMDQRVYVWQADGSLWKPEVYPFTVCHPDNCERVGVRAITSVTVGDVDGDGDFDFGMGTNEVVESGSLSYSVSHLVDANTGESLAGWPRVTSGLVAVAALLPVIGEGHPGSMAFADLDDDGDLEILDPVMLGTPAKALVGHDGVPHFELPSAADRYGPGANTNEPSFVAMTTNPAFADLSGDGRPDAVLPGSGTLAVASLALVSALDFQHVIGAWDGATGDFLSGWPRQVEDFQFLLAPAVADVSGDGKPEAVFTSAGGVVHAADAEGNVPDGWPKVTGQWFLGSPAVGDIDGDGYLEVVVTTREGWLHAWTTLGRADQALEWASLHHDPRNTGNYGTPLAAQVGPAEEEAGGCCAGRRDAREAWVVAPLALLLVRRRRR